MCYPLWFFAKVTKIGEKIRMTMYLCPHLSRDSKKGLQHLQPYYSSTKWGQNPLQPISILHLQNGELDLSLQSWRLEGIKLDASLLLQIK